MYDEYIDALINALSWRIQNSNIKCVEENTKELLESLSLFENICFNSPLIRMLTVMDKEKIDALTKNTPTCSNEFEIFNEDVWETCCDDFCCYKKKVDEVFHFQCIHCGKKIKLIEQT